MKLVETKYVKVVTDKTGEKFTLHGGCETCDLFDPTLGKKKCWARWAIPTKKYMHIVQHCIRKIKRHYKTMPF